MKDTIVGIDVLLAALIGPIPNYVDAVVRKAQDGKLNLIIEDHALYCALYSVREGDRVSLRRLAELLKYAQIKMSAPEFLGPRERESWTPSEKAIENWRQCALAG